MSGFDLSAATIAIWVAGGILPATDTEIEQIAALSGTQLPADYVAFLKTYGFVTWEDGTDPMFYSDLGQGDIYAMLSPQEMETSLKSTPAYYLPVARNYGGQAVVLVQLEPALGSVWHMNENGDIGQIAPDFTSFITNLGPLEAAPLTEKWGGTLITDKATGFRIAQETRDAWEAYGTGSTAEPKGELTAIEETLGRGLPEGLRSFLTTYGYVTFFSGAITTFALPDGAGQAQDNISVIYSTAVLPRALPLSNGAPLPFASTELSHGSLLIGLGAQDEGHIYWQGTSSGSLVKVSDDLRGFLAGLYKERPINE